MSKVELLPATAAEWKEEFKTCKLIPLDFLNDSEELASGSKFEYDHFLRMRILYLFEDQIPKNLRPRLENIFPQHVRDEVEKTFQEDHDIGYMASFLELSKRIKEEWPKENPRAAGFFAIALAKLHQLCVKDVGAMGSDEDTSADKVVASPLTTQSKMPGLQDLELLKRAMKVLEIGPHTTPSRPPRGPRPNYGSVDYTEAFGVENSFFTPSTGPGDELPSPSDTDLRVAQKDFDRDSYIPVDEQIVNVCLDTLLMGLCWVLGYSDRISSERPGFAIPKNSKTNLYKAHVDGLIKRDDGKHPIAFMEVKKALRSTNVAVRRQIGAQMCGFIHAHDADIHVRDEDVFTSSDKERSMWMVSMDGYHGYITLALYDGSYVDYLASSPNSKGYDGFMNLIERGPYDLRIWGLRGMGGFLTDIAILMGGPKASSQIEVQ